MRLSETHKDSQSRFRNSNSTRRKIHVDRKHAQFVTFYCYKRRMLLKQVAVTSSMPGGII